MSSTPFDIGLKLSIDPRVVLDSLDNLIYSNGQIIQIKSDNYLVGNLLEMRGWLTPPFHKCLSMFEGVYILDKDRNIERIVEKDTFQFHIDPKTSQLLSLTINPSLYIGIDFVELDLIKGIRDNVSLIINFKRENLIEEVFLNFTSDKYTTPNIIPLTSNNCPDFDEAVFRFRDYNTFSKVLNIIGELDLIDNLSIYCHEKLKNHICRYNGTIKYNY